MQLLEMEPQQQQLPRDEEEGSESTPPPQSPQSQDTINENNNQQQQAFEFTMIESVNPPTPRILSLNQLLQNNQQNTENHATATMIKSESTQSHTQNNNQLPPQFSGFSASPHHYHYPHPQPHPHLHYHHNHNHNPYSLQNPFQPITLRYAQPIQFPIPPPLPFANGNGHSNHNQIIMFPSIMPAPPPLNEVMNNAKNKKEICETDIFGIGKKRKRGSGGSGYEGSSSDGDGDGDGDGITGYEPERKKMNVAVDNRQCCRYCNKSFVQNCHLSRHIREKHASSTPAFECIICSKSFNQRSNLKVHLRSHALDESVSRPWLCIECYPNRRFTRKSSLKRHWVKKHKTLSKKLISQLDHDTNIKYETTNIKNEQINESIQELRFDNGIYRIGDIEIPPQVFIQQNNSNNLPPLLDN